MPTRLAATYCLCSTAPPTIALMTALAVSITAILAAPRPFRLSGQPSFNFIFRPRLAVFSQPHSRREAPLLNPPLESGVVSDDARRLQVRETQIDCHAHRSFLGSA